MKTTFALFLLIGALGLAVTVGIFIKERSFDDAAVAVFFSLVVTGVAVIVLL